MRSNTLAKHLFDLGFSPPIYVEGMGTLADVFPDARRPGIYVIHFADGTRYVGKSIEVTKRFIQHGMYFKDIRAVSFMAVPTEELSSKEKEVIARLEKLGVLLRNIQYSTFSVVKTPLHDLFPEEKQQRWLKETDYLPRDGARKDLAAQRKKYELKFEKWMELPSSKQILEFLPVYISKSILLPLSTEQSFWSVSCLLPRNKHGDGALCRMNVYWQEVMTVWSDKGLITVYFQLVSSLLQKEYGNTLGKLSSLFRNMEIHKHAYVPGGQDQIRIGIPNLENATEFLKLEPVIHAARLLNLALMRKGNCVYKAAHCPQIVDMTLKQ